MGNKKKKNKPTVSIITISQFIRSECLPILSALIEQQYYTNIIEWIIVEGSQTPEHCLENQKKIQESILSKNPLLGKIEIRYIYQEIPLPLGELRNISNQQAKGDIIVCMDDDDYYPPTRVSHAVKTLQTSSCKIAGCSPILMMDYITGKKFQFKKLLDFHSTNNCFAYKKSYLETNSYDKTKSFGEEQSFTKAFSEPLVQLDPSKTVVLSVHTKNTFNKRKILTDCILGINEHVTILPEDTLLIPDEIRKRYEQVFLKELPPKSQYDIVYYTGGYSIDWDPADESLGGSEQAVVFLSEQWVKKGKKVIVFGNVPSKTLNGVDYEHWQRFPFCQEFNIIVLWRLSGLTLLHYTIKAKQIILDVHDKIIGSVDFLKFCSKFDSQIDKIHIKSQYHLKQLEEEKGSISTARYNIIPNGVQVEKYLSSPYSAEIKNPYRFCYCSCYTRGLYSILKHIWPIIYKNEPKSELHIYYGMQRVKDEAFKKEMKDLLSQPGVMDHGRQSQNLIIREKYMSGIHLYLSFSVSEIDCISVKESLLTGAIPILTDFGVFPERDGIHINYNPDSETHLEKVGYMILSIMKEKQKLDELRIKYKNSNTIFSWENIAQKWLDVMV